MRLEPEALVRAIVVLHRAEGHLRFGLPPVLCTPAARAHLERGLRALPGVYRVSVWPTAGKLAVRFDAHFCSVGAIACRLRALLENLPAAAPFAIIAPPAPPPAQVEDWRVRLAGLLPASLQPLIASALSEKAVLNFLNELLAFYLIKVHWDLITQRWLKSPWQHADAWLATFYLIFLLVRYRKTLQTPLQQP